jgi:hypothetical protein
MTHLFILFLNDPLLLWDVKQYMLEVVATGRVPVPFSGRQSTGSGSDTVAIVNKVHYSMSVIQIKKRQKEKHMSLKHCLPYSPELN